MAIVQVKDLIEAGVHFGHRASRWNPKMRPYIYGKRNLIHIIDLRETVRGLLRAHRYLARVASNHNSFVLFVGTKRQAKEAVEREAMRCGMPYVSERWLGGTLTNHRTIRDRLKRLEELEALWLPSGEKGKIDVVAYMKTMLNETGKLDPTKAPPAAEIHRYSKKMISQLNRELQKIQRNLQGVRTMVRLPDAIVVVDPKREHIAVKEAQRMSLTTVALIDTDSDPDEVDLPIPGNDDSIRSIELMLARFADAVLEGRAALPPEQQHLVKPRTPNPQTPSEVTV